MYQEQINQAVYEISNLQEMQSADLKLLTERYPYCQVAQVLYAKKLHSIQNPNFEKQLQKASAIVIDRNVLFEIIENTPLLKPVAAGFDQEEEIKHEMPVQEELKEEINVPAEEIKLENIVHEHIEDEEVMIHEEISEEVFDQIISSPETIEHEKSPEEIIHTETEQPAIEEISVNQSTFEEKKEISETESENVPVEEITTDVPVMELTEFVQSEEPIKEEEPVQESVENNPDEFDEPLFEMPGYNIERELGTLDEKDAIKIEIQKPVVSEEPVLENLTEEERIPEIPIEAQQHSFTAWFQTIGTTNKAKIIELPSANKPIQKQENIQTTAPVQKTEVSVDLSEPELITEQIAGELAKKSLQFDDRLASETYARILYMQGKYARAIEMYEKLSLLKPAKSDYFAALIEQIKKRK